MIGVDEDGGGDGAGRFGSADSVVQAVNTNTSIALLTRPNQLLTGRRPIINRKAEGKCITFCIANSSP
jgi:hypothetical protein